MERIRVLPATPLRPFVFLFLILAVTTGSVAVGHGVGTSVAPADALKCPEGDMVGLFSSDVFVDAKGGPETPQVALELFIRERLPELSPEDFVPVGGDEELRVFTYSIGDELRAVFRVTHAEDSWYVGSFEACASLVEDSRGES
jgi:hypothetical protein